MLSDNILLKHYLKSGILDYSDLVSLSKEQLMSTIIKRVHHYSIRQTSDGRYVTYIPDETKPNGRRQIKKATKTKLYSYLLEFYGVTEEKELSFSNLYLEWVEYKKRFVGLNNHAISQSTIRRYERDYFNYIVGTPLADASINNISSMKLQIWLEDIVTKKQMSERCLGNVIGYINSAFQYALRSEYIQKSPTALLDKDLLKTKCKRTEIKQDSDRVLTVNEMKELRKAVLCHESRHRSYMPDYAIELAMFTGMRVGEISALHWSDIDADYIRIDYSEHRLDYADRASELIIGEPKNHKHRVIPLIPEIKEIFEKVKSLGYESPENFVFVRKNGKRYTAHDISCAVDRRASEAGIKKTSIHGIRRTVSSYLRTLLPVQAVANMLGHLETTNERYYNYDITENIEKMKALSKMSSNVINFGEIKKKRNVI